MPKIQQSDIDWTKKFYELREGSNIGQSRIKDFKLSNWRFLRACRNRLDMSLSIRNSSISRRGPRKPVSLVSGSRTKVIDAMILDDSRRSLRDVYEP